MDELYNGKPPPDKQRRDWRSLCCDNNLTMRIGSTLRRTPQSLLSCRLCFAGGSGVSPCSEHSDQAASFQRGISRCDRQNVGVPLFALGIFIVQMIRHKLEMLYSTTLFVRAFIIVSFTVLYGSSDDPMFLVLIGGVGFVLTGTMYWMDKRVRKTTA